MLRVTNADLLKKKKGQHALLVSRSTHVAQRESDAKVEDKDEKTRVTVCDIRLGHAPGVIEG